jgi:hypothetical protein
MQVGMKLQVHSTLYLTTFDISALSIHIVLACLFFPALKPIMFYFHSPVAGFSLLVFARFLDHTQRRSTVGRTPLDEWSIRRRDLYLTTHNTPNRQTSMTPVGFEPKISAGERPKTYALGLARTSGFFPQRRNSRSGR